MKMHYEYASGRWGRKRTACGAIALGRRTSNPRRVTCAQCQSTNEFKAAKAAADAVDHEDHSYGHGESCYWCGYNPDKDAPRACDERLHKKPTDAQMRHYDCVNAVEEARDALEAAESLCERHGYREFGREVYDARLRLSDTLRRLNEARPLREAAR